MHFPELRASQFRRRKKTPLTTVAIIATVFILLTMTSQLFSAAFSKAVFSYYSEGRTGSFDGVMVNCNRVWNNYLLTDQAPYATTLCSHSQGPYQYYTVSSKTLSLNVPGVMFYPIYKTQSIFLFQRPPANFTFQLNIFGLGYSAGVDSLFMNALIAGSLPTDQSKYQALVTDFVANRYGLKVGQQLGIRAIGKDYGGFNLAIFSKAVYVSGILSESKLNAEFNLNGVPVFSGGGFGAETAFAIGVQPETLGGMCTGFESPFYTFSDLKQMPFYSLEGDFCQAWPRLFAILGNNLMRDLYGFNVTGPSEVLFRFSVQPQSSDELLGRIGELQTQLGLAPPYSVSMLWRSNLALVGPNQLQIKQTFAGVTQIANSKITQDDLDVGVEISPVIDRLNTIAEETALLVVGALLLGLTLEISVFLILSRKFASEIEIYKANGLTSCLIFRQIMRSHAISPLSWIVLASLIALIVGFVLGVDTLLSALLGLTFVSVLASEFVLLARSVLSRREFLVRDRGRIG